MHLLPCPVELLPFLIPLGPATSLRLSSNCRSTPLRFLARRPSFYFPPFPHCSATLRLPSLGQTFVSSSSSALSRGCSAFSHFHFFISYRLSAIGGLPIFLSSISLASEVRLLLHWAYHLARRAPATLPNPGRPPKFQSACPLPMFSRHG